ncbi:ribonuclease H2 subunit B-like [Asterias rubens]|uniref:ribonuclease H2 subunit B-like n=1 Tax=Asterias rubens TaxID=7604 RepID=UPI001455997A|nr:ribonuclease H2 subunit B-like [Asterias rubens]
MKLRDRSAIMSRKEESSQKSMKTTKPDQNQWVIIAPDGVVKRSNDEQDIAFVKLKHPKTEKAAMFMFSSDGATVHELTSFKEKYRSWIINETVQEDGAMIMATAIDPLVLILPYLIKAESSGMFITLDQILDDVDYPQCHRLHKCSGVSQMHYIANVKGSSDLQAYKYNQEMTLDWLRTKVERLVGKLEEKDIHVTTGSHSATYVRSSKGNNATKEEYLRYATGMISDYLSADLSKRLFSHLGIKEVADKKVVELAEPSEPPSKKAKLATSREPEEDYSKSFNGNSTVEKQKPTKMTAAQKALSKVDKTGMKSLASFFSKPKKSILKKEQNK